MLSYKLDFSSCGIVPDFNKSSHIYIYLTNFVVDFSKSSFKTTLANLTNDKIIQKIFRNITKIKTLIKKSNYN